MKFPLHAKILGNGRKLFGNHINVRRLALTSKYSTHEKFTSRLIIKLLKGANIAVSFGQKTSDRSNHTSAGLAGTVKNISDGSVSIEVEGDEMGAVQKLIDWLYEGPEMAKVTQVSVEDGDWKGMNGFEVLYD